MYVGLYKLGEGLIFVGGFIIQYSINHLNNCSMYISICKQYITLKIIIFATQNINFITAGTSVEESSLCIVAFIRHTVLWGSVQFQINSTPSTYCWSDTIVFGRRISVSNNVASICVVLHRAA